MAVDPTGLLTNPTQQARVYDAIVSECTKEGMKNFQDGNELGQVDGLAGQVVDVQERAGADKVHRYPCQDAGPRASHKGIVCNQV